MRYPGGKTKAVTFSFDDGTFEDEKFIEMLDKYGLKCTFNINGCALGEKDQNPFADDQNRMGREDVIRVFANCGHEIAMHSMYHGHIQANPTPYTVAQTVKERELFEKTFGRLVRGMAYPYGSFTHELAAALHGIGVAYSRTTESTRNFNIPVTDDPMWWMEWHPTCHYADEKSLELAEKFVDLKIDCFPEMFYIWGHTYEFRFNNGWEHIEKLCKTVSGKEDMWYATNIELYDYFKAYHNLEFSLDGSICYNPSAMDVWIVAGGKPYTVKSGKSIFLK